MTETFQRPAASLDWGVPPGSRAGEPAPAFPDFSYTGALPGLPAHDVRPPNDSGLDAVPGIVMPQPLAPLDEELWDKPVRGRRFRMGATFAFLVSLLLHSSLLSLFVGGTTPGIPDGQEAIAVDIITQEQLDIMLGSGSSEGGKPPKVDDADTGTEATLKIAKPSAPRKSDNEAEQKEALNIITSTESTEHAPVGAAERVNSASAAAPRKADAKAQATGGPQESKPTRHTDPKDKPESKREESRNAMPPVEQRPGADGGEARRVASRGGVGTELGPLPPSMKQALMQQLQKQIELCYVSPGGASQNPELPLILIRLNRDGSLEGMPKSLRYERSASGKALVKAALKAVRQCAPYRMPPRFAPYYEDWKEIRAEFEFASR